MTPIKNSREVTFQAGKGLTNYRAIFRGEVGVHCSRLSVDFFFVLPALILGSNHRRGC